MLCKLFWPFQSPLRYLGLARGMHQLPARFNINNSSIFWRPTQPFFRGPPMQSFLRGMSLLEQRQAAPRFKSDVFVAVHATDDLEFLKDWRAKAKQAFEANDQELYLTIAFEVVNELRKLPKTNLFRLDPDSACVGPDSHLHTKLHDVLGLTFRKAHHAKYGRRASNHSGVYLVGPKGVGKSSIMKIACLVSGLLLDNTASAYADYVILKDSHTVCDVIASALKERNVDVANYDRGSLPCETLKGLAAASEMSIALFLDEAHAAYTQKEWKTLHSLVTSCDAAIVLSGSEYRLPLFVKGDSRYASTIRRLTMCDGPHLESLNDTKLTPLFVTGLSTIAQYCAFLDQRPDIKFGLFPQQDPSTRTVDIPGWEDVICSIHAVFGGRLRGLDKFMQRTESSSMFLDYNASIPPTTSPANEVQRKILKLICDRTAGRGFDPFDPVEVSIRELEQEVPYGVEAFENALSSLQENKLIVRGRAGYRYYSPILHRIMSSHAPTVFISHAMVDFKPARLPALVTILNELRVICEDQITHMGKASLSKWMLGQIDQIPYFPGNRLMIVLSEAYCKKIKEGDNNGCQVEFEKIVRKAQECDVRDMRDKLLWCYYNNTFDELDDDVLFTIAKLYNPDCSKSDAKQHLPYFFHLTKDQGALFGALHLGQVEQRPNEAAFGQTNCEKHALD